MSLRTYLAATVIFCNEVKGKSALALSRDLDVQYKTAFVLAHKLREAMAQSVKGLHLGGEGKTVTSAVTSSRPTTRRTAGTVALPRTRTASGGLLS